MAPVDHLQHQRGPGSTASSEKSQSKRETTPQSLRISPDSNAATVREYLRQILPFLKKMPDNIFSCIDGDRLYRIDPDTIEFFFPGFTKAERVQVKHVIRAIQRGQAPKVGKSEEDRDNADAQWINFCADCRTCLDRETRKEWERRAIRNGMALGNCFACKKQIKITSQTFEGAGKPRGAKHDDSQVANKAEKLLNELDRYRPGQAEHKPTGTGSPPNSEAGSRRSNAGEKKGARPSPCNDAGERQNRIPPPMHQSARDRTPPPSQQRSKDRTPPPSQQRSVTPPPNYHRQERGVTPPRSECNSPACSKADRRSITPPASSGCNTPSRNKGDTYSRSSGASDKSQARDGFVTFSARNKTWRLRHAILSTDLFGLKYLSQRIADVAHFLNDRGDLILEEDGLGRARSQLPPEQADNWYKTVLAPLRPVTMASILKHHPRSTDISLSSRSAAIGPIQRRQRSQGVL